MLVEQREYFFDWAWQAEYRMNAGGVRSKAQEKQN